MTDPGTADRGGSADGTQSTHTGEGVDAATLLGDDREAFETALSDGSTSPIAVVGAPYAGRAVVLDAAADRLGADRVGLDPGDGPPSLPTEPGDGPVVVGDCQHLYERTIGGFEPVEAFLDALAGVDATVVTGWNRYAWAYLDAVRGLGRTFPVRVDAGPVATGDVAELVLGRYDDLPAFVPDDPDDSGLVTTRRYRIGWRDRSASIPVPAPNLPAITGLRDGDLDPRDVVFERLAAVSGGNPGVATAIWEASRGAAVRPSDVAAPGAALEFDRAEAFCLRVVLAKERVDRAELAAVVGDGIDRIVGRLDREGLVDAADDTVRLAPAAVPAAVAATERGRIL